MMKLTPNHTLLGKEGVKDRRLTLSESKLCRLLYAYALKIFPEIRKGKYHDNYRFEAAEAKGRSTLARLLAI